jgi:hypothetical protein
MATKEQQETMNDRLSDIADILDRKLDRNNDFGYTIGDELNEIKFFLESISESLKKIANK